jgi:hypothetical protein
MNKIDRAFTCVLLVFIGIAAIPKIGAEYFALLALFEMLVGIIIGMTIFLKNGTSEI